jgi:hypothetical protein
MPHLTKESRMKNKTDPFLIDIWIERASAEMGRRALTDYPPAYTFLYYMLEFH